MSLDLSKLSSKELKELLAKKREEEHQAALKNREAYEGIRAELVQRVENKVRAVCEEVKGLHKFWPNELHRAGRQFPDRGENMQDQEIR